MFSLKDQLALDIAIFLNPNEFAATFNVDGQEIVAVMIDDILPERSQRDSNNYDGVYIEKKILSARKVDFSVRPVHGQIMRVNDGIYSVVSCTESMGMYEITLMENAS